MKVASNMPRLRRRKPATRVVRTSASTVAISPGAKRADLLYVAAILVAERGVGKQILDGLQALGLEHRGARRPDAFHVHEWGEEIQSALIREINSV